MKLATYEHDGKERFGFVRDDGQLVDVLEAYRAIGLECPHRDLLDLIIQGDPDELSRIAQASEALEGVSQDDVTWLPPVRRPSKVIGIVVNNKSLAAAAAHIPDHPVFFFSSPSSLTGHLQPIVIESEYGLTHPEAELGVIVGRRLRRATPEEAADAVFGYTIVNDVTSVGLKSADTIVFTLEGAAAMDTTDGDRRPAGFEHGDNMQLTYHARSKGTDTFTPCGPWIVTRDSVADPSDLQVNLYMGEELCTEDSVGNLAHSVGEALGHISNYVTLEPGDIVHMGTAATGKYRLREIDFQRWDGPCTVEINGLGKLSNPIHRNLGVDTNEGTA